MLHMSCPSEPPSQPTMNPRSCDSQRACSSLGPRWICAITSPECEGRQCEGALPLQGGGAWEGTAPSCKVATATKERSPRGGEWEDRQRTVTCSKAPRGLPPML